MKPGVPGLEHPGCGGIHRCLCLYTPSAEATGQSRSRKNGELGSGKPSKEAAPFVPRAGYRQQSKQ